MLKMLDATTRNLFTRNLCTPGLYLSIYMGRGGGNCFPRAEGFSSDFILGVFYVMLTAHLSIILDNDQLDAHLLYFTIRLL